MFKVKQSLRVGNKKGHVHLSAHDLFYFRMNICGLKISLESEINLVSTFYRILSKRLQFIFVACIA